MRGYQFKLRRRTRPLTPREREALNLLADGLSSLEIAKQWGYKLHDSHLQPGPSHVRRILMHCYNKLGAENAPHAIALAFRRGVIQ